MTPSGGATACASCTCCNSSNLTRSSCSALQPRTEAARYRHAWLCLEFKTKSREAFLSERDSEGSARVGHRVARGRGRAGAAQVGRQRHQCRRLRMQVLVCVGSTCVWRQWTAAMHATPPAPFCMPAVVSYMFSCLTSAPALLSAATASTSPFSDAACSALFPLQCHHHAMRLRCTHSFRHLWSAAAGCAPASIRN